MTTTAERGTAARIGRQMLNKVPEVTLYFWIIKVLCTTVGETAADYLNDEPRLRPDRHDVRDGRAAARGAVRAVPRCARYVPGVYWLAVVLISVVGTLITDNLTDNFGVPLETTTIVFARRSRAHVRGLVRSERTLSIHSIVTTRREGFYWLAILFTFALGTAAGDLTAEKLNVGYSNSALLFAGLIAIVAMAHFRFKLERGRCRSGSPTSSPARWARRSATNVAVAPRRRPRSRHDRHERDVPDRDSRAWSST